MFFPERIRNIQPGDKVLEIGPGRTPHPKATVLLEKQYESQEEFNQQCGEKGRGLSDSRIVYYDGGQFPFETNSFDYVICSHVIEHVENVEYFCSEMFRVAKKGYLEFPLIYYEYLYDFDVHINLLKYNNGVLYYAPKDSMLSPQTKHITAFWRQTLQSGYSETISQLIPFIMEGFEWCTPFSIKVTHSVIDLCHSQLDLPPNKKQQHEPPGNCINKFVKKILGKIII